MSQKQDGRNIYAIMKAMSPPVFLVITTMALWQLMLLGTWCKAYYIYVCIYTYIHHKHTYTHIYTLFISIYYIYINYNSKNANAILHSSQKRNKCFFFFWWHVILLRLIRSVYYWVERVTTVTNVIVKCLKY